MRYTEEDVIQLTRQLIAIESTDPGTYEGKIGDFIYQWMKKCGAKVRKQEAVPGRYNIIGKIEGRCTGPALVYICHMDTVVTGEGWTRDPFGGEIKDGKLYGRGACDMKSGLACALAAFGEIALKDQKPVYPFLMIATVDEEDFMRGVEKIIEEGWVDKDSLVLDAEPTNGEIRAAHKGRTWFEVEMKGVTAHASTPQKGADAVGAMGELIHSLRTDFARLPVNAEMGPSTVTFGMIEGGYRPYVVPDFCKLWIDMRLSPPVDTKAAEKILRKGITSAQEAVQGVNCTYRITGDRPYIVSDSHSYLLEQLSQAVQEVTEKRPSMSVFPGYTDTAVIAGRLGNTNCMSYGPGNLELAHKPDEYVPISDIRRCHKVMVKLAENILYESDGQDG